MFIIYASFSYCTRYFLIVHYFQYQHHLFPFHSSKIFERLHLFQTNSLDSNTNTVLPHLTFSSFIFRPLLPHTKPKHQPHFQPPTQGHQHISTLTDFVLKQFHATSPTSHSQHSNHPIHININSLGDIAHSCLTPPLMPNQLLSLLPIFILALIPT